MIFITENSCKKLSGLSSLFVSFKYNAEIVNVIKSSDKYAYDKETYTWELPVTSLSYLLDNLTYLDDITLQLLSDAAGKEIIEPSMGHKVPPFQHQIDAVRFGLNRDPGKGFLLLDQPGLGKTGSMIYLAEELRKNKGLEHCLIICGINTLKSNWKKEIQKFSDLPVRVVGEKVNKKGRIHYASIKERAAEILNPIDAFFIVINIEMLRSEEIMKAFKKTKNKIDMIVLDEAHKCSGSSQQSANLLKLEKYDYKIGLTGTLLVNSPLSAFIPLKWIGVEHSNLTTFKSQYCIYGGFGGHQIIGYKNIDILKDIIDNCSLRRTKDLLNIPPKTLIKETLALDERHRDFYENIKNGVKEECDKIELDNSSVLALTTRLRQATACPSFLTSETIPSTKVERAAQIAEDVVSQGEKIVIMCTFKQSVVELQHRLKDYYPLICTGDIPDDVVSKNIDVFQEDKKHQIMIATTAKMGTGVTLNAATYMVCLDLPWTWSLFEQVQDRIHRVTNTRPVFIYELVCENTIDEQVADIVESKKALSDFIVDDIADNDTVNILRSYIEGL